MSFRVNNMLKEELISGKLRIDEKSGKLFLAGEVFDDHGSCLFEAGIDTGSDFGLVLQRGLADALCAPVISTTGPISIGGGSGSVEGLFRKVNFRFGELVVENYQAVILNGDSDRNLIGIKFFQDAGLLLLADFHAGITKGGFISSDRKFAMAIGKTCHCLSVHNVDLCNYSSPCLACGQVGN